MWIGERGEIHVLMTPAGPELGPVLSRSLAAASWSRLAAVHRTLHHRGLDPLSLFLDVRRRLAEGSGEYGGEAEAPFVDLPLPDDVRLEIAEDVRPEGLGEALADAVESVPLRWRPDVVDAVEMLLWDLQDRRPRRERGDTVWRRYGRRRGHRSHARRRRR